MPNEESSTRGTMTAAVFIFAAAMLVCPGLLLCVPSWSFRFFETGTVVLAMAGAALLFPQRVLAVYDHLPRGLLIAAGILLGIGLWHGFRHAGQYNASETGELFLTAAMPFCVCVFARELKRLLPGCTGSFSASPAISTGMPRSSPSPRRSRSRLHGNGAHPRIIGVRTPSGATGLSSLSRA